MGTTLRFGTITLLFVALGIFGACASKKTDVGQPADAGQEAAEDAGADADAMMAGSDDMGEAGAGATAAIDAAQLKTVYFGYDRAALSERAKTALRENYSVLESGSGTVIVEGHCDQRGTDEYNLALGERRAQTIKDYLVRLGIPANRISVISYGEEKPAVTGDGESVWSQNRRGEFRVAE